MHRWADWPLAETAVRPEHAELLELILSFGLGFLA